MEIGDEELQRLVRESSGCFELARVMTFKGYRKRKDGAVKEVTVEVLDSGEQDDPYRWNAVATDEDGRRASGNGAERFDVALAIVHWNDLDAD